MSEETQEGQYHQGDDELIEVTSTINAPYIGEHIKESIDNVDNTDEYIFAIQLNYRDNHTVYHLDRISSISFEANFLKIEHTNGSCNYYDYDEISEYHVINGDDITDLWGNEI